MFVIITYDVNSKRCPKVMKICKKYLNHVQRSVFEGTITESKLKRLMAELEKSIIPDMDRICIYQLSSLKFTNKVQIGLAGIESNFI